jgi:uncharacterized protein YggT (Ycf19 family)
MSNVRIVETDAESADPTIIVSEAAGQLEPTVTAPYGAAGTVVSDAALTTIVVPGPNQRRFRQTRRVVYAIINIIVIFIVIRMVLALFGANPDSPFATFIYGVTTVFVAPFTGLFGAASPPQYGVPTFEASSLVAIAIYYLFSWIGLKLTSIRMLRPSAPVAVVDRAEA